MADCDEYVEFWRSNTWDEQYAKLDSPENFRTGLLEFSALLYDHLEYPNMDKDDLIELGDKAMSLAVDFAKEEWRWVGRRIIADVGHAGFGLKGSGGVEGEKAGEGEEESLSWIMVDEDDVLDRKQIIEEFIVNGKPLRCEDKPAVLEYLKTRRGAICYETSSGEEQKADAPDQTNPVASGGEPDPAFLEEIGGREGYFLKLLDAPHTNKDREERVQIFLAIMECYFPHY